MSCYNKKNYKETFATTYPKTDLLSKHICNLSFSLGKTMQHLPKEPNILRLHDRFRLYLTQL